MTIQAPRPAPYGEVLAKLVASAMRAMAEFVSDSAKQSGRIDPFSVSDARINRHFSWLSIQYQEGVNRHLYDGTLPNQPLRTQNLRSRNSIDPSILAELTAGSSIPIGDRKNDYVRVGRTRISSLIRQAFSESLDAHFDTEGKNTGRKRAVVIPSPLAVVYDYLTVPAHPGTRAYPLLSLRNFLFEVYGIIPDELNDHPRYKKFSVSDLELALSSIRTSIRPRFYSAGQDKLPAQGNSAVGTFVRQFLAMKGIFHLRFDSIEDCHEYLSSGRFLTKIKIELERSEYLERLPEMGELVNEIWGLPIPIRGADTVFRGGLKFSARKGLVCALHGGPGSGKTSLSLGIGASLSGFGIKTIFFTAEETAEDLYRRTNGLLADEIRRLSFMPDDASDWLKIVRFRMPPAGGQVNLLDELKKRFQEIASAIRTQTKITAEQIHSGPPAPCQTVVVLDGLHDLATRAMSDRNGRSSSAQPAAQELHDFIDVCRDLQALVILTTGTDWTADTSLDYLVDVAMRLSHETGSEVGAKPDRVLTLSKARHQLCSPGAHGLQIAGEKGVRLTPQMSYQLDRRAIWATRLPDQSAYKNVMRLVTDTRELRLFPTESDRAIGPVTAFQELPGEVKIYRRSNIFINGEGSGGKAALALKIAIAPYFSSSREAYIRRREKILIVSFLYPKAYYENIHNRLTRLLSREYGRPGTQADSYIDVIHLYPGHLKPGVLFNRIEWQLEAAELDGDPFTTVIIEGIHNVFLQFPEIEKQSLFWPQLYSMLRTRDVSIISTHALLTVFVDSADDRNLKLDDRRSEALRHALVQKTDYRFEVYPRKRGIPGTRFIEEQFFIVRTLSAIGQQLPQVEQLYWSRERLVFFTDSQKNLPFTEGVASR
ncbi:RAD55 family ATPase [Rhizobium leguminosarum]|uniref:RAD55 family ATPase n=1 Tax=Rhizobium leguminosarum TaxID=384 RepID=UPI003F95A2E1